MLVLYIKLTNLFLSLSQGDGACCVAFVPSSFFRSLSLSSGGCACCVAFVASSFFRSLSLSSGGGACCVAFVPSSFFTGAKLSNKNPTRYNFSLYHHKKSFILSAFMLFSCLTVSPKWLFASNYPLFINKYLFVIHRVGRMG